MLKSNLFNVTDILLVDGDALSLNLSRFPCPFYLSIFSKQAFGHVHLKKKIVNIFVFYLATFPLQNVTGQDAGLDGKI